MEILELMIDINYNNNPYPLDNPNGHKHLWDCNPLNLDGLDNNSHLHMQYDFQQFYLSTPYRYHHNILHYLDNIALFHHLILNDNH